METNTNTIDMKEVYESDIILINLEWEDEKKMIDIITKTTTTRISLLDLKKKKWKRIDSAPVTLQEIKGCVYVNCDLGYWSVIATEDGSLQADIENGYDEYNMKTKMKYMGEDVIAIMPVAERHRSVNTSISLNSFIRELCDPILLFADIRPYINALKETNPQQKMELSRDCMDVCTLFLDYVPQPDEKSEIYTLDDMLRIVDETENGMQDDIHCELYDILTDERWVIHN